MDHLASKGRISLLRKYFDKWNSWSKGSVNRRIFAAMITVGALTFVVKLMTAGRELVIAHYFGVGDVLDAFLIAFMLPQFAVNVLAGSFRAAFIPTFIQLREKEGSKEAERLFLSVMICGTVLLVTSAVFLALFAEYLLPLFGSGFSVEKLAITKTLFYMLLPIIVISGLSNLWAALLNSGEHFKLAAVAPIMAPAGAIILLLIMGGVWGIYALVIGTVVGFFIEAILLMLGLKRRGIRILPRWHGFTPALKGVIGQYLPMVAGAFLMSATVIVDRSMAAMLGTGSVSALSYGNMVIAFILGIGMATLGTSVLPYFSRMVAEEDWSGIRHTFKTYARLILLISVPATILLIYFSEPIVRIVFERGEFTADDTRLVGSIQALYLLQAPFFLIGILGVRLLSALKMNQVLMFIAAISLIVNIIGNYIFMKYLGVAGISLSTSLVYLISMILILFSVYSKLRKRQSSI